MLFIWMVLFCWNKSTAISDWIPRCCCCRAVFMSWGSRFRHYSTIAMSSGGFRQLLLRELGRDIHFLLLFRLICHWPVCWQRSRSWMVARWNQHPRLRSGHGALTRSTPSSDRVTPSCLAALVRGGNILATIYTDDNYRPSTIELKKKMRKEKHILRWKFILRGCGTGVITNEDGRVSQRHLWSVTGGSRRLVAVLQAMRIISQSPMAKKEIGSALAPFPRARDQEILSWNSCSRFRANFQRNEFNSNSTRFCATGGAQLLWRNSRKDTRLDRH